MNGSNRWRTSRWLQLVGTEIIRKGRTIITQDYPRECRPAT
jgi:hypothetical protein